MGENNIYTRTTLLVGENNIEKIKKANVLICGIGGVGSYTLEAIVRAGVLNITIIDKDIVDITNINRQIIALNSTIGMNKVDVAKKRAQDINKNVKIKAIKENITKENIENLIDTSYDYVVDCVDNVEAKIAIILTCNKKKIKCISCMGTGNKLDPTKLKVADIYKTNICPLAKIIRKNLKKYNIKKQKVVFSEEVPTKNESKNIGSISFVPSVAGLILASQVVNDIIENVD